MPNSIYQSYDDLKTLLLNSKLVKDNGTFSHNNAPKKVQLLFGDLIHSIIPDDISLKHKVLIIITNNSQRRRCSICNSILDDIHIRTVTCSEICHRLLWKRIYTTKDPITNKSIANLTAEKVSKKINYSESSKKMVKTKRNSFNELGQDIYQQTAIKTAITRNGEYKGLEGLSDSRRYRALVGSITNKQDITSLDNFEKRGNWHITQETYHLDHMFSISDGFKENIPPYIIGHISNLIMLPASDNLSKSGKSSVTKEELFSKFDQAQIG